MPRGGRFVEILVAHLQEFFGPDGIEVRSPEEFRHNGKKIGEIDVTLRGNYGSSKIFVGIECRDRPSGGPQGLPWINEIKGKQELLKVDKIIAVSTTGFTADAIHAANDFGIDLLTIENPTPLVLRGWFETITFAWTDQNEKTTEVMVLLNQCRRLSDDQVIALTGTATVRMENDEFKVLILVKKHQLDLPTMDLRISFLTLDDKPYILPAGARISLYG
jgi:hypothetical protein